MGQNAILVVPVYPLALGILPFFILDGTALPHFKTSVQFGVPLDSHLLLEEQLSAVARRAFA